MKKEDETHPIAHAAHDILLEADPASLRTTLTDIGVDAQELIRRGRVTVERAINSVEDAKNIGSTGDEHQGLQILLRLLRRRDNLSEEQLAERARVDVAEIRRIEYDPTYAPLPRTIYQLEQVFQLPKRSLVKLAGVTREQSPQFADEVLRFAANAKTMEKLTREETKILNAFVRFLSSNVDPEDE
jgi:transcriptional regulator with XRE-family HTH domain